MRRALVAEGDCNIFAARGYDLKKLYHHPELGVLLNLTPGGVMWLSGDLERNVHVLRAGKEAGATALCALIYRVA